MVGLANTPSLSIFGIVEFPWFAVPGASFLVHPQAITDINSNAIPNLAWLVINRHTIIRLSFFDQRLTQVLQ